MNDDKTQGTENVELMKLNPNNREREVVVGFGLDSGHFISAIQLQCNILPRERNKWLLLLTNEL